ncbi:MAG: hypothetical protein SFY81_04680 [Verrucomicrobiota bacterium]|nr:hypothetical protein [Verrucomicrobiota bacterium]
MVEFLAIMFVGTLVAIWAVFGSRPGNVIYQNAPPRLDVAEADIGDRNAEIWQWNPNDQVEYMEAIARYEQDPLHNPFPSPVQSRIQDTSAGV